MSEIVAGLPADQHEYGIANGHAPVAAKVICVDFDSTLVEWSGLMDEKQATDGAVEFMRRLRRGRWKIVIFTSRLSVVWARSVVKGDGFRVTAFLNEQEAFVRSTLDRLGIPYDAVTGEKVPSEWIIDDKAIGFRGDWAAVGREVFGS